MADLESFKLPSSKEVVQKLRWRLAVLIQLVAAKPDQVDKVVDTFLATYRHVQEIWTALKHNDSPLAFTFDTAADGSRDVNELLQSSLVMQSVRTMKTHTKVTIPNTEKTAGVPVGLVIFFKAKPGKAGAVRELVFSTIFSFIKEGEGTLIWFGLEYPDIPGLFGILDFFTDEEGRTLQRRSWCRCNKDYGANLGRTFIGEHMNA
ncbi:hypothetical protein DFS33DRAFT_1277259 [Desarmillaria ectypa]|nr:hypothetical protein DFS33DRAFT_1277259 [Desarmillaria ectypa]